MTAVPEIDCSTLEGLLAAGCVLVDVREPDEWADGHIEGAIHMPLATVPDRSGELPTDRPVYMVCGVGGRSARAAEFLRAQGVDAINVAGGTQAWIASGRAVVPGAGES